MKSLILILALLCGLFLPARASELSPPEVPDSAESLMPDEEQTFGEGLWYVVTTAIRTLKPELAAGIRVCLGVLVVSILTAVLRAFPGGASDVVDMVGAVAVAGLLLGSTNSLIGTSEQAVGQLSDYGKMLLPVMAATVAAQGGTTSATALYSGTAIFDALLSGVISKALVPMVYAFLTVAVADCVLDGDFLKRVRDFVKWMVTWCLKTILYIYTGYMSITGVVTGTTDKAALKAAKLTISGAVPVVGGILSDASEALLVSAGVVKSATGIYGMWAIIAVAIGPFLKVGIRYLLLKAVAAVSEIFAGKKTTVLLQDFSTAMGLLLGMTGAMSLLFIISVVCLMKGVG